MGTFTLIQTNELTTTDSSEGNARCSLHGWVGIDTQKDVIYIPTRNFNLCVFCYHLFHSDIDILNTEDSISKRFKGLKARKTTKF